VVTFSGTAAGTRTANIVITSNDCSIPNYSFVLSGTTSAAAALNFDGTNDYVSVAHNSSLSLNSGSFTIEFWAKPNAVDGNHHWVVSKDGDNTSLDYLIGINASNQWRFLSRNLNTDIFATTTPVAGTNYHLACVSNGSQAFLYVNGVLVQEPLPILISFLMV
jgi:hypothetical protein